MKKLTSLLFLCAIALTGSKAQIINTIAGDGAAGYFGDGGAATASELTLPSDVKVDDLGNIFIADQNNNCIRKVTAAGIISTIAGNAFQGYSGDGGAATAAELSQPQGIALDGSGNIYIADVNNNRIRKVTTAGVISTFAGDGINGYSGDGGIATTSELSQPAGVAVDGSGNIFIVDVNNDCIRKVTIAGVISTIAGDGDSGYSGDGGAATSAEINKPFGVAVDGLGNIYIADTHNNSIRKVNTAGIISTIAGDGVNGYSGDGGIATTAELSQPAGVAADGSGNVYIADDQNNRIRKITTAGIINTIAGDGTAAYSGDGGAATTAELFYPQGVTLDGSGNIYIADYGNNRIRKVTVSFEGIEQLTMDNLQFTIYPNPASQRLCLSFGTQGISAGAKIKIMDITDKVLSTYSLPPARTGTGGLTPEPYSIDISKLSQGMYFISIENSVGAVVTKKFVKL